MYLEPFLSATLPFKTYPTSDTFSAPFSVIGRFSTCPYPCPFTLMLNTGLPGRVWATTCVPTLMVADRPASFFHLLKAVLLILLIPSMPPVSAFTTETNLFPLMTLITILDTNLFSADSILFLSPD